MIKVTIVGAVDVGFGEKDGDIIEGKSDGSNARRLIELVNIFNLRESLLGKRVYSLFLKACLHASHDLFRSLSLPEHLSKIEEYLKANNPGGVQGIKVEAQVGARQPMSKLDYSHFYTSQSEDPSAGVLLLNYRGDTPYSNLWRDDLYSRRM